jgi:hypothetical protein
MSANKSSLDTKSIILVNELYSAQLTRFLDFYFIFKSQCDFRGFSGLALSTRFTSLTGRWNFQGLLLCLCMLNACFVEGNVHGSLNIKCV